MEVQRPPLPWCLSWCPPPWGTRSLDDFLPPRPTVRCKLFPSAQVLVQSLTLDRPRALNGGVTVYYHWAFNAGREL